MISSLRLWRLTLSNFSCERGEAEAGIKYEEKGPVAWKMSIENMTGNGRGEAKDRPGVCPLLIKTPHDPAALLYKSTNGWPC
jgi:hypothetical protein